MFKKMNLPNKLTILRIILVPFFIVAMALPIDWVWPIWTAFGIYIVAAFTDFLDGQISRRKNMVTKFGKIMDPLADKLLVSSGFIMLSGIGVIPTWITAIIIFRDFFVNALRMFGAENKTDLAAGVSGKIKTIFQLFSIVFAILGVCISNTYNTMGIFFEKATSMTTPELLINVLMTISIGAAVVATIWSLIAYIIRFKKDINVEE